MLANQTSIVFVFTPTKTIVKTKHQTFIIQPSSHLWKKYYLSLIEDASRGRITNMTDLVDRCNNRVEFVPTKRDYV